MKLWPHWLSTERRTYHICTQCGHQIEYDHESRYTVWKAKGRRIISSAVLCEACFRGLR